MNKNLKEFCKVEELLDLKYETLENEILYLKTDNSIKLDSLLFIEKIDIKNFSQKEEVEFDNWLIDNSFCEFLSIFEVEDIVDNLKAQSENISKESVLKALIFYFENDAFIELDSL